MKNAFAFLLGALAILTSGCQVTRALRGPIPESAAVGLHDARAVRIGDVIKATMRKQGIPGLSVAVIDHGEIVWAQGFGWRDIGNRLPVDTDTQFQAGSISKSFTAPGVLQVNAGGKVDLDADVNRYLKSWHLHSKFTNDPVTIRELLCHRAGMVPHGFLGCRESTRSRPLDRALNSHNNLIGWLTGHNFGPVKVLYRPGSRYRYSGGGYCVVQKAVEDVTGEPFAKLMQGLVLEPLKMNRSHFQQPPKDTANTARGYGPLEGMVFRGRWLVYPEALGGLWSTPPDLARMIIAVQKARSGETSGSITPAIAKEFLTTPYDGWQGIGVRLGGEGKDRTFYHGGETIGYLARFAGGINYDRGWVIMSNAEKDHFGPITKSIAKEFGWAPSDESRPSPTSP